jgi:hypothetical protein
MSIVEQAVPATAVGAGKGRTSYGIDVCVGKTVLNEWALTEAEAKDVHENLLLNDDQPLDPTADGIVYKRRAPNTKRAEFAEVKAKLLAKKAAAAATKAA